MRQRNLAVLIVFFSTLLLGCRKIQDHYRDILNGKPAVCKLVQINNGNAANPGFLDFTDISYNSWGFPSNVKYTRTIIEESPPLIYNFIYTYDSKKRLISNKTDGWVYSQRSYSYAYNGNSQLPVRDTFPGLFGDVYVEDLDRDNFGRVIKLTRRVIAYPLDEDEGVPAPFPPDVIYKYYYDIKGNRQEDPANPDYPGVIKYTNKPSLYTLHPVWEITHHNSSRNLPDYAATYNAKGYPTKIKADALIYTAFLTVGAGSQLTYQCKN